MIKVDHVILSDDIKENFFVCDLNKCKGACCVEGDLGAPLEEDELDKVDENYKNTFDYLPKNQIDIIESEGGYIIDEDDEFSTNTVNGKECVFAYYDNSGILKCAFEKASEEGKSDFRKPISCHLYPIRISVHEGFEFVNYDRWHICNPACKLGKSLGVPLYRFLKEPLVRRYGVTWYNKLLELID